MCMSCKKTTLSSSGKKTSSSRPKSFSVATKTPFGKSATKITFGGKKK